MNTGTKICCAVSLLTLAIGNVMAAGPQTDMTSDSQAMTRTVGVGQSGIDPQALARAQTKLSHAVQLTHRFDAGAAQEGRSNDLWRSGLIASLMRMNESDFAAIGSSSTLSDAITSAERAAGVAPAPGGTAASIGQAAGDLTFYPINPCRILDTRAGSGNGFIAGQTRTYSFNSINVGNGGCVPSVYTSYPQVVFPAAVAANVTVDETGLTGFAAGSYLAIYPQAGSPGTSFINFGPNQILANAGVFSINQSNGQFNVLASAPANVIIDVFGVFVAPSATALDCVNTANSADTTLNTTTYYGYANAPACPAGYTRVSTFANGSSGDTAAMNVVVINDGQVFMRYWGTTSVAFHAAAKCCRVPGY